MDDRYNGNQRCVGAFSNLLTSDNDSILSSTLSALEDILKVGQSDQKCGRAGDENVYLEMLCNAGGIDRLEHIVQHHPKGYVRSDADRLLNTYYWMMKEYQQQQEGFFSIMGNVLNHWSSVSITI